MFDLERYRRSLDTDHLGRDLKIFDRVDSTNSYAAALYEKEENAALAVMAERQTEGRGRHGRSWETAPYDSLAFSFPIPTGEISAPGVITLAVGVALVEAVQKVAEVKAGLKYPNDLHIAGRKAAGVLTEQKGGGAFAVVGIGINVNNGPETFEDDDVGRRAISLKEVAAQPVGREELLAAFFTAAEPLLTLLATDGPAPVIERYRPHALVVGREVTVTGAGEPFSGVAEEITDEGGLVVRVDGEQRVVVSGEVTIRET